MGAGGGRGGSASVPGPGCWGLGGLGLGRSGDQGAGWGAVRGPGGGPPPGTEASGARGQLCPKGHSPQLRPRWAVAMATREGVGWGLRSLQSLSFLSHRRGGGGPH